MKKRIQLSDVTSDEPISPARELLSGWGGTAPTSANVYHPNSNEQIRDRLLTASSRGVIARGLGRSYGDPAQNAGGDVLELTGFNTIHDIDLKYGRVRVDAGISLGQLMSIVVPLGYFVPVTPGTRHVTVGGAIACDIHGKNHHKDGSFAEHIESFSLLTSTGKQLQVTRDQHADIFWATAGGMGLTGIILDATIQLLPIETSFILVDTEQARDLDDVLDRMHASDDDFQYSVAWVDTLASGASLGRSVLYRGNHASIDEIEDKTADLLAFNSRKAPAIPNIAPSGLIRTSTARMFNELWYRKAASQNTAKPVQLASFFHQLDMVNNVNRVYGSKGFLQYQFVVPINEEPTLRRIVETLSAHRLPSFLTVLKKMGANPGLISFPMEGWTLAVDLPATLPGLAGILDQFDELIAQAGGRVYLAKDSRLRPEMLPAMYPQLDHWRNIASSLDPAGIMQSDLNRRLKLRTG